MALSYIHERRNYSKVVFYIETEKGSGSGFVLTEDGYAVTCAHVVADCKEIYVKIQGEGLDNVFRADLVKFDNEADIALIKIEEYKHFYAYVELEQKPYLGEEIVIYGYPFGKRLNDSVMDLNISFAKGYVSSNQTIKGINKTILDISAKAGNSGSPIISVESGRVIGILCGSLLGGANNREEINYMLPISYINRVLNENTY